MSKTNPNEIGTVTIDISNDTVGGPFIPFISPLSSSKGRTTLYIPRFKSIKRGNDLLPALQKYIGIDKVGLSNKKKWLENAQYLFMDKTAVETFLKIHTNNISSDTKDPNIIKENAAFIIKEIYFPKETFYKYKGKLRVINDSILTPCEFTNQPSNRNTIKYV